MFSNFPYFFVTIFFLLCKKTIIDLWWEFTSIFKNLGFKISTRTLKNIDYLKTYLKFKKTLKFGLFCNNFFKI